jgi:hypothetical protein
MHATHAAVMAVLSTLVRATADPRVTVTFRTTSPGQAQELARWLAAAHGSPRQVIASGADVRGAEILLRLPRRMIWPVPAQSPDCPLASRQAVGHLSGMNHLTPPAGAR